MSAHVRTAANINRLLDLQFELRSLTEHTARLEDVLAWQNKTTQKAIRQAAEMARLELRALDHRLERLEHARPSETAQTTAEMALALCACLVGLPAMLFVGGLLAAAMVDQGKTPVNDYPPSPVPAVVTTAPEVCVLPTQQEREACARALFP